MMGRDHELTVARERQETKTGDPVRAVVAEPRQHSRVTLHI